MRLGRISPEAAIIGLSVLFELTTNQMWIRVSVQMAGVSAPLAVAGLFYIPRLGRFLASLFWERWLDRQQFGRLVAVWCGVWALGWFLVGPFAEGSLPSLAWTIGVFFVRSTGLAATEMLRAWVATRARPEALREKLTAAQVVLPQLMLGLAAVSGFFWKGEGVLAKLVWIDRTVAIAVPLILAPLVWRAFRESRNRGIASGGFVAEPDSVSLGMKAFFRNLKPETRAVLRERLASVLFFSIMLFCVNQVDHAVLPGESAGHWYSLFVLAVAFSGVTVLSIPSLKRRWSRTRVVATPLTLFLISAVLYQGVLATMGSDPSRNAAFFAFSFLGVGTYLMLQKDQSLRLNQSVRLTEIGRTNGLAARVEILGAWLAHSVAGLLIPRIGAAATLLVHACLALLLWPKAGGAWVRPWRRVSATSYR